MRQNVRTIGWMLLGLCVVAGPMARSAAATVEDAAETVAWTPTAGAQIAWFRLDGEVPEVIDELTLTFSPKRPVSLERWLRKLAKARNDAAVKAVVLQVVNLRAGWAQVQELRSAIDRLRQAGKEVHCYLTDADLHSYLLATACDRIVLAPAGHVTVPGLYLEVWFYKGLMDKLGITADILHIGDYKGAGEPFTRTQPSPELQQQMTELVDGLYGQLVEGIAKGRSMAKEKVETLINRGIYSAAEAVEVGLVDDTLQLEEFLADIEAEYEATVADDYGSRPAATPDLSSPFALFRMFSQAASGDRPSGKPAIGLIFLSGMIVDNDEQGLFSSGIISPEELGKAVDEAIEDDNVKAVVLRINSPGGSALASDIMYSHIRRLLEAKPVVVSMGNVAASGGYYVAAAGPVILAEPGTITGSIGVLGGKVVLSGLLEKIGVSTWSVSRGQMAGMFDSLQPFTPAQREQVLRTMNGVYRTFLNRVLETRADKLARPIEDLAGGRVYTGHEALKLGLVDRLGGMTDAVYLAAEQAGVKGYEIRVIPKPKSFFEALFEGIFAGQQDAQALHQLTGGWLPAGSDPASRTLRRVAMRAAQRIELLRRAPVLLLMPFDTNLVP